MPRRGFRTTRDRTFESELKFRVEGPGDHARLRAVLRKRGARLAGRYREENLRFTGPGKSTRNTTLRLRIFDGGPRGRLTAKGPATFRDGIKTREETEVEVTDANATLDLLEQLGFRVGWAYPKRRGVWILDGVTITLDVLDFGWFVELEGPPEKLSPLASDLGLDPRRALRDSYSVMAREHMRRRSAAGLPAATGVLPAPATGGQATKGPA